MSTRLDLVLQKHPEHEEGIRLLASRDPSPNLKYLDWGAKILASGQALALEIADILDLFHRFQGQRLPGRRARTIREHERVRVHPDIYTYRPQDLANLRDLLLKLKRAQDRKRRVRERLYRIEGEMDSETVYDSDDLIVRHIKNKQASVHYGLGTKWCIAMKREGHFEEYETHNATFFFFERKTPLQDDFDKVALMMPRNPGRREYAGAFTALDEHIDMLALVKVFGGRVFDIFRDIYARSEAHPPSAMFRVYTGTADQAQLEVAYATLGSLDLYELRSAVQGICCNDAAPLAVLEAILRRTPALYRAAARRRSARYRVMRRYRGPRKGHERAIKTIECGVMAAMVIHPNVPSETREAFAKTLRRRHINTDLIRRAQDGGRIEVAYDEPATGLGQRRLHRRLRRRWKRRSRTVSGLRASAKRWTRYAARALKQAETLERKLAAAKKKKKKVTRKRKARK